MRIGCLILASSFLVASSQVNAIAASPVSLVASPEERLLGLLRAAGEMVDHGQLEIAAKTLDEVLTSPNFDGLPPEDRHAALQLSGAVAFDRKEFPKAVELLKRSSAMPLAQENDSLFLLRAGAPANDPVAQVDALVTLAKRWPQRLTDTRSVEIRQLAKTAARASVDHDAQYRLLDALNKIHWEDAQFGPPDDLWSQLVLLKLARGDVDGARRVARGITKPDDLIGMHADRRFDVVIPNIKPSDVEAALAKSIERSARTASAAPRQLTRETDLLALLLKASRFEEVVERADRVLVTILTAPSNESPYDDIDKQLCWVLHNKASALVALSRYDEALAVFQEAANHSHLYPFAQAVNLANLEIQLGKPQSALLAITTLGTTSPLGSMVLHGVRQSAFMASGDTTSAAEELSYLREHQQDEPIVYFEATLRQHDREVSADALVTLLENPDTRFDVLMSIQHYQMPDTPLLASVQAFEAERQAVIAMPRVAATLERVGRIDRYRMYRAPG